MSVSEDDVLKIAQLAHLEIEPDEISEQTERFNKILAYIDQMKSVSASIDRKQIPWFVSATPFRSDEVRPSLGLENGLPSRPKSFKNFIVVPKVVDS